jgi:type IV pilus assembly protein PilO
MKSILTAIKYPNRRRENGHGEMYRYFNELNWSRRGKWPKTIKIASCMLLGCLVFCTLYSLMINDNLAEYDRLIQKLSLLKVDYLKKYHQVEQLETQKKQWGERRAHFEEFLKQLPTENEMSGLSEDIFRTGVENGLSVELFSPSKEITTPFYKALPVNMTVLGTYNQLTLFMRRMAKISRVVTLHDFTVSRIDKENVSLEEPMPERLVMNITIKLYMIKKNLPEPFPPFEALDHSHFQKKPMHHSPFKATPRSSTSDTSQPDLSRSKKIFERVPLDELKFVGVLQEGTRRWALIRDPEGSVQRIIGGDYMGQDNGQVIAVNENSLIVEKQRERNGYREKHRLTFRLVPLA